MRKFLFISLLTIESIATIVWFTIILFFAAIVTLFAVTFEGFDNPPEHIFKPVDLITIFISIIAYSIPAYTLILSIKTSINLLKKQTITIWQKICLIFSVVPIGLELHYYLPTIK